MIFKIINHFAVRLIISLLYRSQPCTSSQVKSSQVAFNAVCQAHTVNITNSGVVYNRLGWLPLFERRKHSRLTVFYKAFNNLSAFGSPLSFITTY